MADKKISELTAAATLEDTDVIPLASGGVTKKITGADLKASMAGIAGEVTQAELDAHVNDVADAHDASAISSVAAGSLVATSVQAALNELDSEKAASTHVHAGEDITSGTVADARIASSIARDAEVTAAVAAHEADITNVHGIVNTGLLLDTSTTLDEIADPVADVSLNSHKITNLATPTTATDAATKGYTDAIAAGLDVKMSVRAATTANITLSGAQTIDGVSVVATNRVLVKNQSAGAENGIYVAAAGAWARATDADVDGEVNAGMFTFIEEGTTLGDQGWVLVTNNPITVGTTALVFTQFSGAGATPTGAAGGVLSGTYPNPGFAVNMATQAELDVVAGGGLRPETFGAVGDGTTNDRVALQSTAAAASAGDTILLSAGRVYNVKTVADYDQVIVLPDGVHLVGEPGAVLQIDPTNDDGPIMVEAGSGCIIEGVEFDMNDKFSSISINFNGESGLAVRGCKFRDANISIYLVGACSDVDVCGNHFSGASYGVLTHDDSTATRVNIYGNKFKGGSARDAVALNTPTGGATNWNVYGNFISGYTGTVSSGFGISIARGRGVNVYGNYIQGCTNHGIHVEDGSFEITIDANHIWDILLSGIYVVSGTPSCGRVKIVNNTLRSCGTNAGESAIFAESSGTGIFSGVTISGNQLFDNGKTGIVECVGIEAAASGAEALATDWTVTDNLVVNQLGNEGGLGRGIDIAGGVRTRVSGNVVDGCAKGIILRGTWANSLVDHNNVIGCTVTPLTTIASGTVTIRDNIGYLNAVSGATSVADGGAITHGLVAAPTKVRVTPSVASEMVAVTTLGASTFTVAIRKQDGDTGTTQTVYWEAEV